jgi:Na+-transporting NADH:ubiquinone oxidoreductase subunit NqrD
MIFEELCPVEAPVSDFSAGLATGIGFGLALISLGVVC